MKQLLILLLLFGMTTYISCSILKKKSPESYMESAKKYYDKKDYPKAYKNYTRAIKLNPILYQAYWERANVEVAIGDSLNKELAIDDITKYIESNPEKKILAKAYNKRAELELKFGYKSDACSDWLDACNLNQDNAPYSCEQYRLYCK